MSAPEAAPEDPEDDLRQVRSLRDAARLFCRQPGPRFMLAAAALPAGLRLLAGRPRLRDAGIALAMPLAWGFQEWLAHKYLLHMKPRRFLGRRLDFSFARVHRAHHREPWKRGPVFLPLPVVVGAAPLAAAAWLLAFRRDRRSALTAMTAYAAMALAYEWTHFLTHTGYAPKSRYASEVVRSHRLHHFKNERFWLGFTVPLVDRILKTAPAPADVETSRTARSLGVDDAGP